VLNRHAASVACTTCNIPQIAKKDPTDMRRDWSKSEEVKGQGRFEPHIEFARNVKPVYAWWNGKGTIAHLDQPAKPGPNGKVSLYRPEGSIDDPGSKISPFKYHTGRLPVESASGLMIPVQVGPTFRTGNTMASALGGAKGFLGKGLTAKDVSYVEVDRWLGIFHEVVPKAQALKCNDCPGLTGKRSAIVAIRKRPAGESFAEAVHCVPVGVLVVARHIGIAARQRHEGAHHQTLDGAVLAVLQSPGERGGGLRLPVDLAQEALQIAFLRAQAYREECARPGRESGPVPAQQRAQARGVVPVVDRGADHHRFVAVQVGLLACRLKVDIVAGAAQTTGDTLGDARGMAFDGCV
jgi:hypothetical protein